jgi:hypothetical protein
MRKIKWLIVYPVGLIALLLMHRSVDAHTFTVMVLVTVCLLLVDLARRRRRS